MDNVSSIKQRESLDASATTARGSLTGIAVVQYVFHFLHGPADVLRASTVNRRWRELACADAVWRVKCEREGMLEKAGAFEVALPGVVGGGGGRPPNGVVGGDPWQARRARRRHGPLDGLPRPHDPPDGLRGRVRWQRDVDSSGAAAQDKEDETAGVGLAFYAQMFALKVMLLRSTQQA